MLQLLSKVEIIDNSGGTRGRIIKILNKKKYGKVGGLVLLSVTKNVPNSKIRKGTVHKAIVVRTSVKNRVLEKSTEFFSNSVVLVKVNGNDYLPMGCRAPVNGSSAANVGSRFPQPVHLLRRRGASRSVHRQYSPLPLGTRQRMSRCPPACRL